MSGVTKAQPFKNIHVAERFADILERLTGEECTIVTRGFAWHVVVRKTAEGKWVRV